MRNAFLLVFYDLPSKTKEEKRNYHSFVKSIKKDGFRPLQKSVYYKYVRNTSMSKYEWQRIRTYSPQTGSVFGMVVGYHTFLKTAALVGKLPDIERAISPVIII